MTVRLLLEVNPGPPFMKCSLLNAHNFQKHGWNKVLAKEDLFFACILMHTYLTFWINFGSQSIIICVLYCYLWCVVCLGFSSHLRIFHSYGDVTITVEGLQNLTYARHAWPLSSEGSLACHTYCDKRHTFHTWCRAFGSRSVSTWFYDLILSWCIVDFAETAGGWLPVWRLLDQSHRPQVRRHTDSIANMDVGRPTSSG